MCYITMIFDLKDSKKIENRYEVQKLLINALRKCNETYSDLIVSPFLITLGDEWEGLLKKDAPYDKIISFFRKNIPDYIDFYTGIGIGEITINNFELTVNQLDGPSFHLARKAIKYAKKNHCSLVILVS